LELTPLPDAVGGWGVTSIGGFEGTEAVGAGDAVDGGMIRRSSAKVANEAAMTTAAALTPPIRLS
jgi:fructose-1-phosphate kinase PfkB-like protein